MEEYFKLIRVCLEENRVKGGETYYESHHIVPKSFDKKSSTVLLTPEEHYLAHKYLADYWKDHSVYGRKMLWAFHRLAYDKQRKLSKEEYGDARRVLMTLWKADKSLLHREKISLAMKGNTNSKSYPGMKSPITAAGRKALSEKAKARQIGGKQWYGGPYTVTYEDGRSFTGKSYADISKLTDIKGVTLQARHKSSPGKYVRGWKIE